MELHWFLRFENWYFMTLALIDGNSLIHRAYHALPPLTTPKGKASGAVYGFTSMLLKVIDELKPTHIAVAWDTGKPTFRHQEYAAYKEHRPKMPQDLFDQLQMTKEVVGAFNIPQYEVEGYEADDVVGTLASQASQIRNSKFEIRDGEDMEVTIVTGDLDLLQLVNEQIQVFTSRKGFSDTVTYDIDAVEERFDGLSPEQIVDYKALKGDSSDNIPGVSGVGDKTATKLLNEYGDLEAVYENLDEISTRARNNLIKEQEEAFLSQKLAQIDTHVPIQLKPKQMRLSDYNLAEVRKIFQQFGFRTLLDRLPESENTVEEQDSLFSSPDVSYETPETSATYNPTKFDIQIAAHLLTGETGKRLDLENLAFTYLGEDLQMAEVHPSGVHRLQLALQKKLQEALAKEENAKLKKLFYEVEMPLKPILRRMEQRGVLVDRTLLTKLTQQYGEQIAKVEAQVYHEVGYEFNLNSPKQLEEVLFDTLDLPVIKRTKTQRSTDESVLNKLLGTHPVIKNLLKYRKLSKLKSTYLDPLPKLLDEKGRVHTTFNQTKTASGRLSSESPNLQNIPKGDDDNLRRLFIAPKGQQLLVIDYSQIELRILAHLSQDEGLLNAFEHDQDVHAATGARIFDKTIDEVSKEDRGVGKTINFALMYGMSEYGLAESLGIDKGRAKLYIKNYFKNYPGVREWQEKHLKKAREKGYVESLYGRRRYLPGLKSGNFQRKSAAERIAINHPMQATQADIIKKAMIQIDTQLTQPTQRTTAMLLQVHDELVFEVVKDQMEDVAAEIKKTMENVVNLSVSITADAQIGENWGGVRAA